MKMAEKSKAGKHEASSSSKENKAPLVNSVSTDSGHGSSAASSNNSSTKSTKNAHRQHHDPLSNLVVAGHQQSVLVQASQQQLTIKDAFDPDDSETKHITTSSYWLNELSNGTQSQLFSQTNPPNPPKPPAISKTNGTTKPVQPLPPVASSPPSSSPQVATNPIGKLNILPLKANDSIFINNTHNNKQPKTFAITSNSTSSSQQQSPVNSSNGGYNSLTSSRYYYSNFNTLSSSTSSNSPLNGPNVSTTNKQGNNKYFTKTNNANNNMNYIQQILNVKSKPVLTANASSALSNSHNLTNSSSYFMNSNQNGSIFNKSYTTSLSYYNYSTTSTSSMNRSSYYKYLNGTNNNPTTVNGVLGAKSITSLNKVTETKYVEYRRKWVDMLRKEKRKFDTRWTQHAQRPSPTIRLDELEFRRTLGTGSFGRVILVKMIKKSSMEASLNENAPQISSNRYFALKVLEKKNVIKTKQVEHTLYEKKILSAVSFPFIASMYGSFKDNANLYLLLEFVSGGEMFAHLTRVGRFSEKLCKFYCAQVILAIEYLHSLDIIHRDLKPENTLIASDGYIKISDFGFAKYVKTRTYTLCGTPEYLAPEVIQSKPYGKAVDWWAVGILTYEISTGTPPFQSDQAVKIYEKILAGKYKIPTHLSDEIKDFMKCLIQHDVTKRYGNLRNGVDDIKTHRWLDSIDWMALYQKKLAAPMIPKLKNSGDASNFDKFADQEVPSSKEMLYEREFEDF